MHDLPLILELATDDDADAIERLNERVFGPGRYARTAYRIRETTPADPALSFVARVGTLLVGASAMTPIVIGEASALLLGPLIVEPVFFSHYAQGHSPVGPTLIRRMKAKVHLPLLAGGGITAGNAHQVIAAGADGVSVTSEVVDAHDPERAASALMSAMRSAWATRPLMRESVVEPL